MEYTTTRIRSISGEHGVPRRAKLWLPPTYRAGSLAEMYDLATSVRQEVLRKNSNRRSLPPKERLELRRLDRAFAKALCRNDADIPDDPLTEVGFALFSLEGPVVHDPTRDASRTRAVLFDGTDECLLMPPRDFTHLTPSVNRLLVGPDEYRRLRSQSFEADRIALLASYIPNGHVSYYLANI